MSDFLTVVSFGFFVFAIFFVSLVFFLFILNKGH